MLITKNIEYFELLLGKLRKNGRIFANKSDVAKIQSAFEKAHDIRKFEIGLYWQRSAYMWGFITVLTAVCAYCFTKLVDQGEGANQSKNIIVAVSLIASFMGLVFTQMWRRLSATSKYWQENWEYHINVLEEYVSGNLHKIHFYNAKKPFRRYSIHEIFTVIINRVFAFWWFMVIVSFLGFFEVSGNKFISNWLLEFLPGQHFLYQVAYPASLIVLFIIIEIIIMLPEKVMKVKPKKEKVDGRQLTFTCDEFTCMKDSEQ